MKKIFGYKSITHLLYGLLLLLPFLAILGRSVYTIANKNANQSYYGETINNEIETYTNYDELVSGETYKTSIHTFTYESNLGDSAKRINVNNFSTNVEVAFDTELVSSLGFYYISSNGMVVVYIYNDTNVELGRINSNQNPTIEYTLISKNLNGTAITLFDNLTTYQITYNKYSYLDNAFEYSLSTFIEENEIGNVDFFSWFTNIFLNQTSPHNALYLNFANWYLNYIMLVSCGYLLFLVLLWFVNYSRSLLEHGMNRDNGGF